MPPIVKAIIDQPNPELTDVYFQLGAFICTMLFATRFKIDANIRDYELNTIELNKNNLFFVTNDNIFHEKPNVSFLHNALYELTTQKDMLARCETIIKICQPILNTFTSYETNFKLQYISFVMLKRIYFTFPQFRKQIDDTLLKCLSNLFNFVEEKATIAECIDLIRYLLNNEATDPILKLKLKAVIEDKDLKNLDGGDIVDVESEELRLSDFNLKVGCSLTLDIEAGTSVSKYIEVVDSNSLIYIAFATMENDITIHLLKYISDDSDEVAENITSSPSKKGFTAEKGQFKTILRVDRIDSSKTPIKLVIFVKDPGTYEIIWDNSFSWFTGKILKYRLSVLKPLTDIDIHKNNKFEVIGRTERTLQQDTTIIEMNDIKPDINS
jgi:hypothetical protein